MTIQFTRRNVLQTAAAAVAATALTAGRSEANKALQRTWTSGGLSIGRKFRTLRATRAQYANLLHASGPFGVVSPRRPHRLSDYHDSASRERQHQG